MTDELEKIWKEAVVAWYGYYRRIFLEGLRKTTKTLGIAGVPAEIQTKHLLKI
jgi:hypothetical protein